MKRREHFALAKSCNSIANSSWSILLQQGTCYLTEYLILDNRSVLNCNWIRPRTGGSTLVLAERFYEMAKLSVASYLQPPLGEAGWLWTDAPRGPLTKEV